MYFYQNCDYTNGSQYAKKKSYYIFTVVKVIFLKGLTLAPIHCTYMEKRILKISPFVFHIRKLGIEQWDNDRLFIFVSSQGEKLFIPQC